MTLHRCVVGLALVTAAGTLNADMVLGPADILSMDQPRVAFALEDAATGEVVGPFGPVDALLDTGANGLLLAKAAWLFGETYDLALRGSGEPVIYTESGVSGSEPFNILVPYDLNFAGSNGVTELLPQVNFLSSQTLDLGGLGGIVGMPAMADRVTVMDFKPMVQLELITTTFAEAPPVLTSTSYHVALAMLPPEYTGSDPDYPDDPKPNFSSLPLVNVVQSFADSTVTRSVLLDTGAQSSIISTTTASLLGIDLETDILDLDGDGQITEADYLEVGGIGGSVLMPFVRLKSLGLDTIEGQRIVLTNVDVGVLDIAGIDGVLGMNILTSGYGDILLGGSTADFGYFGGAVLDFRDPETGYLRLDVNPAFVPEPTSLGLLAMALAVLGRHRSPRSAATL